MFILKRNKKNDKIKSLGIDEIEMISRNKKYLDNHPYSIWQSKDKKYWYTTFPDKTKDKGTRQIRRNSLIELQIDIIDFWKNNTDVKCIEDIFQEWNDRKLELNKISANTHLRNIQIFEKHYSDIAQTYMEDMCPDDFVDFLEEQIPLHSMTSKAFSNLKGLTKGLIKWARKKHYIDYTAEDVMSILDVSDRSFKKVIKEDEDEVFDEVEMPKIISYLIDNKDLRNLGILLMFVSGIRVGELVGLKHSDFVGNQIKIRRTETRVPKDEGGGSNYIIKDFPKSAAGVRSVIIPEEYQWLADELSVGNPDDFVFVNEQGDRFTTNVIRRRLKNICNRLEIKNKSPHKIRKTYGSILLDNNIDNRFIMNQMGHTDISCTEGHYHRNRRDNEKKAEILSKIPDFQSVESSNLTV